LYILIDKNKFNNKYAPVFDALAVIYSVKQLYSMQLQRDMAYKVLINICIGMVLVKYSTLFDIEKWKK